MVKILSKSMSFKGWELWEFVKGRKKMVITMVASLLGYAALDQELVGLLAGPVFEAVWSVVEYYAKEYRA